MGWGLLAYNVAAAAFGATNVDLTAVVDQDFSQRNGHYIFTNPYKLHSLMACGVSITRGRLQVPTYNAIGEFTIFNPNRALQPPTNPQWDMYYPMMPDVPQVEEFQVQLSNNLGAATEQENVALRIATPDWNMNLPAGKLLIPVRATFTLTPTINVWSGPQALTLSQSLRGGVYAVLGATVQGTNAAFFRFIFPRYRLYRGQKLRPGGPIQTALGDVLSNQNSPWLMQMGEWGRFWTQELPQIEVLGTTAGSITYQVFMWLMFLGEDLGLLQQGLGGG